MASPRQEQTTAYAAALVITGLLFSLTVWIAGARASTAASEQRLDLLYERQALIAKRADSVVGYLDNLISQGHAQKITALVPGTNLPLAEARADGDSVHELSGTIKSWLGLRPGYFDPNLPDYLIVFSDDSRPIFLSSDLRDTLWGPLLRDSLITDAEVLDFFDDLVRVSPREGHTRLPAFGSSLLVFARAAPEGAGAVSRVLAATRAPPAAAGFEGVAATLVVVSPILILLSLFLAHRIAGRPMQPVESIINEVQAITDGTSLHRRLGVHHSNAQLSRLAETLNEMMQRLETSFSALRTFTADASHELNTPLTVLRADVERAMSAEVTEGERLVALEESLQEISRMTDLVGSLLTLARVDEGRYDLHRESIQLAEVAHETYETALLLGEDAGVVVKLTILEQAIVMGDRDRLRQLFMNLVTNAIKYTPRGGRVELGLSHRVDGIAFSVRDTGIGISAADLPHVFERFWRADHSRSRASQRPGSGLGLPIAMWIAQAHGGTLTVTSKLTKGSTFTVTLPLGDAEPLTQEEKASLRQAEPTVARNQE